jgi:CRP/FNR family putative post-exponential-phase nitrogen-starvation transcriptional regulator
LHEDLPTELLDALEVRQYCKGEYFFFQDERLKQLYLLVEGKLQVDYLQPNGRQAVYSFETPFSIIGDMELLSERVVTSNVKAIEDSVVLAVPIGIVNQYALKSVPFLQFIIRYLSKKMYFASMLLAQYALSAESRLAHYLLERSRLEGQTIRLEKRDALAAILGVSVRHLNRSFKSLVEMNAIRLKNRTLVIVDPQTLTDIVLKRT